VFKEEGKTADAIASFRMSAELPTTVASDPRTKGKGLRMAGKLERRIKGTVRRLEFAGLEPGAEVRGLEFAD